MLSFDFLTQAPFSNDLEKGFAPYKDLENISPLTPHKTSQKVVKLLEETQQNVRRLLKLPQDDVLYFCSSHAIALHQVLFGTFEEVTREYGKNHFLTTAQETATTLFSLQQLQKKGGTLSVLPLSEEGLLTENTLIDAITPRSALLSLSFANPLLGTVQQVDKLVDILQERGVLLHLDLSFALLSHLQSVIDLPWDYLTLSADTLGGPKHFSVLMHRKKAPFAPLFSGSEPDCLGECSLFGCFAFAYALQKAFTQKTELLLELARKRALFEQAVQTNGITPLFANQERLAQTSCLSLTGVHHEALLYHLEQNNIAASIGGGSYQEISHLLQATRQKTPFGMSFTLSQNHSDEQIQQTASTLKSAYHTLRTLSQEIV